MTFTNRSTGASMNVNQNNRAKMLQAEAALAAIVAEALRRGFYGKAALELSIQDGVIQHIRRVVEKIDK
jgi:hypothetical protein